MTLIQSFVLGLIQGIGEFLPISSSAHLSIAQRLLGLQEVPLEFDLLLHMATLIAVCIFFRKKIWKLLKVLGRWITRKEKKDVNDEWENDILCNNEEQGRRTIIAVIVSTIVTGVIGVIVDSFVQDMPKKIMFANFIITSSLLILSSMMQSSKGYINATTDIRNKKGISVKNAIIIGLMQGFGTIPGISRSGSTISGAIFCNIDRQTCGDYSFLISIPAIMGAFVLKLKDFSTMTSNINILPLIVGFITALVVGYISLASFIKIIRKGKLQYFSFYLIPLGVIGLIFF